MPRPSHWPTKTELEEERLSNSFAKGPFPFISRHIIITQELDGNYREDFRSYEITRARTPEEMGTARLFPILRQEFGRRFRIATTSETPDEQFYRLEDGELIRLKELP